MLREIISHPATHIALALATGLPLVSCTARPDNATGSRNPNNNVTTKATLLPEVINQARSVFQPGQVKAFDSWFGRFNRDLSNSSKSDKIRLNITSQLPIKGKPFK